MNQDAATIEVARTGVSHDASELPPLPSDDQEFFNESQRVGIRAMREILRRRKKKP
jgi:hypothetical protein